MKKCGSCKGAKKIMGLGYIMRACKKCAGSGLEINQNIQKNSDVFEGVSNDGKEREAQKQAKTEEKNRKNKK